MNVETITSIGEKCIGCGVCTYACAKKCISMKYDAYGNYRPVINETKCNKCGLCLEYCIQSEKNKSEEINEVRSLHDPEMPALKDAIYYYGRHKKNNEVIKSCSGGVVTTLSCKMLEKHMIDAVVHAERVKSSYGGEHYKACVSRHASEVMERRGSIYGPVCFDEVLKSFVGAREKILVIGTPCTIRAMKKLFDTAPQFKGNTLYTIALMCGHSVSGAYTSYLGKRLGIRNHKEFYCDMRKKDRTICDRMNFKTCFYESLTNGEKKIIAEENRFKSGFTETWRAYFFAQNGCFWCSDFYGRVADASFKDAWGKWGDKDRYGSCMMIIRNSEILETLKECEGLRLIELKENDIRESQPQTVELKEKYFASHEAYNEGNDRKRLILNARLSSELYRLFGIHAVNIVMLSPILKLIYWLKGYSSDKR